MPYGLFAHKPLIRSYSAVIKFVVGNAKTRVRLCKTQTEPSAVNSRPCIRRCNKLRQRSVAWSGIAPRTYFTDRIETCTSSFMDDVTRRRICT